MSKRRASVAAAAMTACLLSCGRPRHEYSAELVDNFGRACRARGGTEAACGCALDRLRERWTEQQYRDLETRVAKREEAAARALADATADCRGR
jgi:hypothetical protein